jgi:hypothetical protein
MAACIFLHADKPQEWFVVVVRAKGDVLPKATALQLPVVESCLGLVVRGKALQLSL